jgi:hypothetical protein
LVNVFFSDKLGRTNNVKTDYIWVIIERWGYKATFGISSMALAVILPFNYFFVLETAWNRNLASWRSPDSDATDAPASTGAPVGTEQLLESSSPTSFLTPQHPVLPKKSYTQGVCLFNGRFSQESYLKILVKPLRLLLLLFPAISYSAVVGGLYMSSTTIMALIALNTVANPPYNLNPVQIGLATLPNLITSFIARPIARFLVDFVAKELSRRNNGMFEPEFRLWLKAVALPLSTAGFVVFGWALENDKPL